MLGKIAQLDPGIESQYADPKIPSTSCIIARSSRMLVKVGIFSYSCSCADC